ncbi:MAG: hypothetical protein LBR64_01670 [Dysgonamonadaceae bacterium]|nr:hypothetical protein [Dysgonamonadaceae bacterium]
MAQTSDSERITSVNENDETTAVASEESSNPEALFSPLAFSNSLDVPVEITDARLARNYRLGTRFAKIGKVLTFVGAPVLVLSSVGLAAAINSDGSDFEYVNGQFTGDIDALGVVSFYGLIAGIEMVGVGIPLWITGSIMKKNTLKAVNEQQTSYQPNYRLGVTESGGIGLTINF